MFVLWQHPSLSYYCGKFVEIGNYQYIILAKNLSLKLTRYSFPIIGAAIFSAVLFFFRLPVSGLLNVFLVKPLFTDFESSVWTDAVLATCLLVTVVWIAKEQPRILLFKLVFYGLIFYIFQRTNSYWIFTNLATISRLAYWDLVAACLLLPVPLSYLLQSKIGDANETEMNPGFVEDNVVNRLEDDHFRRKAAAGEIAGLIALTRNKKSFAIGILGEYGSGKTSFLNLINLELNETDLLKVSFNPWSAGNPETIRREFFNLLARRVADVDLKMSSLIYSYGRNLASFDERSLTWLKWLGFFRNRGSVQSSDEYQQINNMLRGTGKKIVISIDDLDRLYPAEIMEVLKLIRNTADFSNVFYLVGYDKDYVQAAMKTLSETGSVNYLDKIFQLEIPLPKREEDDLLVTLQEHLKKMISPEHFSVFENILIPNGFRSRYEKAYSGVLRQGRDVVRFINGFKIVYKLIGEEVDFECLVLLELIKFRFPAIYELIYTQHDLFLYENPVRSSHQQHYEPRMVKENGTDKRSEEVSLFKTHIEKYNWLNSEDVSLLDGLFLTLFKKSRYRRPEAKNSIVFPLYFEIYFRYRLSQKDLSDKDFKAAIASGHMREYMVYCASHGLHKELMVRLMQEEIDNDQRNFEQVIRWIFSFGRTFVEKESKFRFDYEALIDKIYNYHNRITNKLYKKETGLYKEFINHLFSIASAPFLFENDLIYHLKKMGDDFVVPVSELTAHQYSYFTQMAESGHVLSEDTLWLFWGAREHYKVPADDGRGYYEHWRFEPLLVPKMTVYLVTKDITSFLKFTIEQGRSEDAQYHISKQVVEMFDAPATYRELVATNGLLDEDVKLEYLEFFDKVAATDFKHYVEMDFKTDLYKPRNN
jgi:hypothetical protein